MLHKLHDRKALARVPVRGLSCDETGLYFAGDCPLTEEALVDGERVYRHRPIEDINRALSAGYGVEVDLAARKNALDRIADHLTRGEVGKAQIMALQLGLPDLAGDADVDRLLKADRLLRFNPNHDERGRFASAPGGGDGVAVHAHISAGGTRYSTALRLSPKQTEMAGKIIDYGKAHGFRPDQITIAVSQAFYESSLGTLMVNPTTKDPVGLFQYELKSWRDLGHSDLNRYSDTDQIVAIFRDIQTYERRYDARMAEGKLPKDMFFANYFALRYHLGPNSQKFTDRVIDDYDKTSAALDFNL